MIAGRPPLRDSYEGILGRARLASRAGRVDEGLSLYRHLLEKLERLSDRALARRPELGEIQLQTRLELADLLRHEGRYAEAIEVKQVLLTSHPDQADRWRHELAVLKVARGEVEQGLAELQSLAKEHPDDLGHWLALGREARIEGRFRESRAALDQALDVAKGDPQEMAGVHRQRFLLFKSMGQLDEAITAWEAGVSLDPELTSTVGDVYAMLSDAGRFREALQYVARDENPLQSGFQRGLIAHLTGNPVGARQEWQAVAGLDPEDYDAGHDCWTEAVLRLGDPMPALERLEKLLRSYGTPRLLILSGIAWAMRGDRDLASRLFQQAIHLLRRDRPAKKKLDGADWRLLNFLVKDEESKAELKPYFAVVETVWG